ncbi:MAG: hypothetical protein ACXWKB_06755 [Methyloceanibacter sp.]
MQSACIQWGGAAAAAVFALLVAAPLRAADNSGVRPVAEELGQRTKPTAAPEGEQKAGGLSDSAVRVLMTYALSIIPDTYPGPDGKPVKVDKSDPNKFVIPVDDARRIVRAATRSAYAQVCDLKDLERANFQTLMRGEEEKKVWSKDQMLLISALHMFSVSYFTGSIKITTKEEPEGPAANPPAKATGPVAVSKNGQPAEPVAADPPGTKTEVIAPQRPTCSPEQKIKVTNAINAYVAANAATQAAPQAAKPPQAEKTAPAEAAAPPPANGSSN